MRHRRSTLAVVLIAALVWISSHPLLARGFALRPVGYETEQAGGSLVRFAPRSFPLHMYSADARFDPLIHHAIDQWNDAARQCGIPMCFQEVVNEGDGDFAIDWSGNDLPSGALGATHYSTGPISATLLGITMQGAGRETAPVLTHALMQEMGHSLGLGHSRSRGDIMYDKVYSNRWSHYSEVSLSSRDRQMLRWLYNQDDYVAFRTARAAAGPVLIPSWRKDLSEWGNRLFNI